MFSAMFTVQIDTFLCSARNKHGAFHRLYGLAHMPGQTRFQNISTMWAVLQITRYYFPFHSLKTPSWSVAGLLFHAPPFRFAAILHLIFCIIKTLRGKPTYMWTYYAKF